MVKALWGNGNMLRLDLLPSLLAFAALLLAAALLALSASGHFPHREHADGRRPGTLSLWGSMLAGVAATAVGVGVAWQYLPWAPAVIAGGLAILAAPLVLQKFPDRFVDGRGALAAFGGGAVLLAALLVVLMP
jgi:hypothetical protein